jgi:hypothetical protein
MRFIFYTMRRISVKKKKTFFLKKISEFLYGNVPKSNSPINFSVDSSQNIRFLRIHWVILDMTCWIRDTTFSLPLHFMHSVKLTPYTTGIVSEPCVEQREPSAHISHHLSFCTEVSILTVHFTQYTFRQGFWWRYISFTPRYHVKVAT